METVAALALTLLAGILIGTWGIPALKAQTGGQGTYVVAETHVIDTALGQHAAFHHRKRAGLGGDR
jgi:hypothetical protein